MKCDGPVYNKSFDFAVRIVKAYGHLTKKRREFVLSKQLLRSGTSIGANVSEAKHAQSRNDFLSKMGIALKEAAETKYWIELLIKTDYLTEKQGESLLKDCTELISLLHAIIKTTRKNSPSSS